MQTKNIEDFFYNFLNKEILTDYCNFLLNEIKDGKNKAFPYIIYDSDSFIITLSYYDMKNEKIQGSSTNDKFISILKSNIKFLINYINKQI